MSLRLVLIALGCFFSFCGGMAADAMEKDAYEATTGFKGSYDDKEKVFRAVFVRNDLLLSVENIRLDPFVGGTSWAAFMQTGRDRFMVMGDLAVLQDEANAVMSTLFDNGLSVTALHNHFFYDHPRLFFMHFEGEGMLADLARGVKKAVDRAKQIRASRGHLPNAFDGPVIPLKSSITPLPLEKIFGRKAQTKEGMVKFIFGRTVTMHGVEAGSEMGVNAWAAFTGSNDNAIVDGDFAVHENELQPVLKTLRRGDLEIVAIHNHMAMESPRMLFIHYRGKGSAASLAKTIQSALNLTTGD